MTVVGAHEATGRAASVVGIALELIARLDRTSNLGGCSPDQLSEVAVALPESVVVHAQRSRLTIVRVGEELDLRVVPAVGDGRLDVVDWSADLKVLAVSTAVDIPRLC